ncbi:SCO0607 family lipoprotein [Streptomyces sp. NPDC091280]|uniref:SCO0607 family lipoprotein n=1 Tax=Streptomyces sp. NPDC091280 TaxID=3365984 RepID=UPI00380CFD12
MSKFTRTISGRARAAVLTAALISGAGLLSACSFTTADAMCSSGEYPVLAVDSTTGGACVKDGDNPPSGYARYPKGKTPQHVDDKWDTYWRTHTIDAQGNVSSAP